MPNDYTIQQMLADIMAVVQENAPYIIAAAILLACVNFIINWFMHSLGFITKDTFGRR